ncbi:response regulator [Paenibacillus sp. P25]|nr:response regulator [Paenibacillus sp. P25]
MKAIIVDDEKHVREAIKLLVPWEAHGIGEVLEAQDGLGAIRLIEEHKPQIIFTDMMMPLKSGMELMVWLQQHYPFGKTIVISGHDDFELVRHTIQHGGIDYILKPIDADQLEAAVAKAASCWRREEAERRKQQEHNIERNQYRPVYWEKIWSDLLAEPAGFESHAAALREEFGIPASLRECRVAVLTLDTMSAELRAKFASHPDLLFFSITNIANEILKAPPHRAGTAFRYWNSDHEIAVVLYGASDERISLLASIQSGIQAALRSSPEIGVSSVRPFPAGLPSAYSEARTALKRRNLLAKGKGIHRYTPETAAGKLLSFSDYAESLRLAIRAEAKSKSAKRWRDGSMPSAVWTASL